MAAAPPLRTGNLAAPPTDSALRAASHVPDDVDAPARKISDLERPTTTRATAAAATPAPLASPSTMAADPPLRTGGLARPSARSALRAASRPPDSADVPARRKSKPKRPPTNREPTTPANPAAAPPPQRHRPTEPSAESTTLRTASTSTASHNFASRRPGPSRATTTQAPVAAATPAPKLSPMTIICLLPALLAMPPLSWLDSISRRLLSGIVSTMTTPGTLATAPPIMPIALALLLPALVVTSVVGALAEVAVDLLGIYLISVLRWQAPREIYQRYEAAHHPARRHAVTKFLLGLAWTLRFAILVSLLGLFEAAKLLALGAQRLALKLQRWSTPLEHLPPGAASHLRLHDLRPSQTISRATFTIHRRSTKAPRRRPIIARLANYLRTFWPVLRNTLDRTFLQLRARSSSAAHVLRETSLRAINYAINFARHLLSLLMAAIHAIQSTLLCLDDSLRDAIRNNTARAATAQHSGEETAVIAVSTACPAANEPPAAATHSKPNSELPCLLSEDEQMPSPCRHPRSNHNRKRRRGQSTIYNVVATEVYRPPTSTPQPSITSYYAALTSAIALLRNRRSLPCRILPLIAAPLAITTRRWDALQQPSYYFPEDDVIKWALNTTFQ